MIYNRISSVNIKSLTLLQSLNLFKMIILSDLHKLNCKADLVEKNKQPTKRTIKNNRDSKVYNKNVYTISLNDSLSGTYKKGKL